MTILAKIPDDLMERMLNPVIREARCELLRELIAEVEAAFESGGAWPTTDVEVLADDRRKEAVAWLTEHLENERAPA